MTLFPGQIQIFKLSLKKHLRLIDIQIQIRNFIFPDQR